MPSDHAIDIRYGPLRQFREFGVVFDKRVDLGHMQRRCAEHPRHVGADFDDER